MIDTHCHLNFNAFKKDYREVASRSFSQGVEAMLIVGSNYQTSKRAIELAQEFNGCYAALGLHPIHVNDEEFKPTEYISLISINSKIVKAIGETGLDYFHHEISNFESQNSGSQLKNQNFKERQKNIFLEHLKLAKEFNLPIILHCRGATNNPLPAYQDLLDIILRQSVLGLRASIPIGVIHCFSANWQIAQKFLDLGLYIGFTGIITFKNCHDYLLEVVEKAPLEKILIETDAPYLAPEPYRGQRCEPWHVKFTAQKIAEIKKISLEEVLDQTTKNAKNIFKI